MFQLSDDFEQSNPVVVFGVHGVIMVLTDDDAVLDYFGYLVLQNLLFLTFVFEQYFDSLFTRP